MPLGDICVGDQGIYEEHSQHTAEEGQMRWAKADDFDTSRQEFHERDHNHHACGEAQSQGHKARPWLSPRGNSYEAADGGGQPSQGGQYQSRANVWYHVPLSFYGNAV